MSRALRGYLGWALVEFARNPYVSLVYMFVFAPYFAATVVGDPVRGQKIWSESYAIAGVLIGIIAPILGAVVDRLGRRKPWIVGAVAVMAPCCWLLWYAMPGALSGLSIGAIACLIVVLIVAFECGAVAHNAMLPSLASGATLGKLSGAGLVASALGSVLAQIVVLFGIVFPATHELHAGFVLEHPLFGLDPATFQHARIVGPFSAIWMVVFVTPLMLWTPDLRGTGVSLLSAVRQGLRHLLATLRHARAVTNVGRFLVARMLYNDAALAVQAYCGIYAAGVFGWTLANILVFALTLSVACIFGGLLGGWLDGKVGSRRAILISVLCSTLALLVAVSVTPTQVFFVPYHATRAVWSLPYFRTLPELVFLAAYITLAITITGLIANSRAMMARIAPTTMMSQFFGLYALSGTATAFLGHGVVAIFTGAFASQRAGLASLLLLLAAGWGLMLFVREERSPDIAAAICG